MIPRRLLLILLGAVSLAYGCFGSSGSAKAGIVCGMTSNSIDFGTSLSGTATLGYDCTNYDSVSANFTICGQIGTPSYPGSTPQPKMGDNLGNTINFNLYTNASHSTLWVGSTLLTKAVSIPPGGNITGSLAFYGLIPSGQGSPAGTYSSYFFNTILGIQSAASCLSSSNSPQFNGGQNTLNVQATISNNCTVSAGNLSLGSALSTATGTSGSTSISINCPSGTAYYIGLAPSNGSTTGAGTMTGTGANTDHPAYQLRSGSAAGSVWGNTATASSVGNGVAGTGTGSTQTVTAYASMPSANYTPDTYSDTVTVNVNY